MVLLLPWISKVGRSPSCKRSPLLLLSPFFLPRLAQLASFAVLLGPSRSCKAFVVPPATRSSWKQIKRNLVRTMSQSDNNANGSSFLLSPRIQETLDPCVVLMKEIMSEYAHLWEDKGGIFSLAQGVVYWEPPESCTTTLMDALQAPSDQHALHSYGPEVGIPALVQTLQGKIAQENGLNDHDIMVTVGANQAYMNCVLTIMNNQEKSKAVVFAPYYFNHVMALQMACGPDSVVVGPTSAQGIPDLDWLRNTLQDDPSIQMVTVVNPGNPTGVSLDREVLQDIVQVCKDTKTWLILDCTYEYFTTPAGHQPLATFPDDSHVIHIFSLSKSYSLAGYRCGYLVLPRQAHELKSQMIKVQDTIPIGPPRISQTAALGALQGAGKEWVYAKYQTLDESRQAIRKAMEPLPIMGGSGAMYFMAQLLNQQDDVQLCRDLVQHYGIAIIPGTYCGFPGWIRVCYANLPPAKCVEAADRLKNGLTDLCQTTAAVSTVDATES